MKQVYRDKGAVGALLDEYERSIGDLIDVIQGISDEDLIKVIDPDTDDNDCKSIQTILTHVVQSGYTYVVEIRKWCGEEVEYKDKVYLKSVEQYQFLLLQMFQYNVSLFIDYPDLQLNESDWRKKINTRWGQHYDLEQIFAHAIVHILRHRRQIERFMLKMT